jgi:hypothetical protein
MILSDRHKGASTVPIKPLFRRDQKRYSWLCQQNVYNINKLKDIKDKFYSGKIVDISFNIINKVKQGDFKRF